MNWKKLLIALGVVAIALLSVLFGGGMMLDGNVHLQTEATLDAPPEMVFALVADPAGVIEWWTGADKEPGSEAMAGMTIEQGPADPTVPGATVFFKMGDTLSEEWTLVSANSPTEVVWDVDFQMFLVRRTLTFEAQPEGKTKMTWSDVGNFESPLARWFTLMPTDSVLENFQGAMRLLNKKVTSNLEEQRAAADTAAKAAAEAGDDDSAAAEPAFLLEATPSAGQ
jgi:uncharacterized protein YndB with AHSA1/START domain